LKQLLVCAVSQLNALTNSVVSFHNLFLNNKTVNLEIASPPKFSCTEENKYPELKVGKILDKFIEAITYVPL